MNSKTILYLVSVCLLVVIVGMLAYRSFSKVTKEEYLDYYNCINETDKDKCNKFEYEWTDSNNKKQSKNVCFWEDNICKFHCSNLDGKEGDCKSHTLCDWKGKSCVHK